MLMKVIMRPHPIAVPLKQSSPTRDRCATEPSDAAATARAIGRLSIGGDWACAHGDIETLSYVARELSEYLPEPLHCELVALAELCLADALRASAEWLRLRELARGSSNEAR